jgi:uncharacterized membrane protein YgcG
MPRKLTLFALALLLMACTEQPPQLVLLDNTATLEAAELANLAAPLLDRGATVVLVLAESGGEEDFARQLEAAGLLRGGQIAADAIGVYVSIEPRYSELRAGERWSSYLPATALERIRAEALNPALRDGQVAAGFAAALSATEAEIIRQRSYAQTISWSVYGALAALLIGLFGVLQYDNLRRSPPARLIAWIWARTPSGRAAARRKLLLTIAAERSRVDGLDRQVRTKLEQLNSPRDFMETLAELDMRRTALAQSEDLAELRALRSAYDAWMVDVDELHDTRTTTHTRAEAARTQMDRLRADMTRATSSDHGKGKPSRPISDDDRRRLADLEARLAELEQSAVELEQHWHKAQDRQVWLHQLGSGYRTLEADALALWKDACPDAYAADATRRHKALATMPNPFGGAKSNSRQTSRRNNSSDSSDWSSNHSGGGESRSGGDW